MLVCNNVACLLRLPRRNITRDPPWNKQAALPFSAAIGLRIGGWGDADRDDRNEARERRMADKIATACSGSLAGKSLAVLGLTFKPNTDDMRDAPSLEILPRLIAAGARIRVLDPECMDEAKKLMPELVYCRDAYQTTEGADALILLTEWNEFRGLDLGRVRDLLASPLVIDLRNIYQPQEMAAAGFSYLSIGRPAQRAQPELRALA